MKIRFGVVGCGYIAGKSFIPALMKSSKAELISVASRDINKANFFKKKYSCDVDKDYESLMTRDDIDAVYIATVPSTHEKIIKLAAKNRKNILCEKPLSTDYESVLRIFNYCDEYKVGIFEGYMYQFHSQHKKVKGIINQNIIGEPKKFYANFGFPALSKNNYRNDPELGGGACLDAGVYTIHAARKLFGSEPKEIFSVLKFNDKNADIHGSVMLNFDDERTAQLSFGFNFNYQNNYMIWGSKGNLFVNRAFSIPSEFKPLIFIEKNNSITQIHCESDDQFLNQINYFCDCLGKSKIYKSWRKDSVSQFKVIRQIFLNTSI